MRIYGPPTPIEAMFLEEDEASRPRPLDPWPIAQGQARAYLNNCLSVIGSTPTADEYHAALGKIETATRQLIETVRAA